MIYLVIGAMLVIRAPGVELMQGDFQVFVYGKEQERIGENYESSSEDNANRVGYRPPLARLRPCRPRAGARDCRS